MALTVTIDVETAELLLDHLDTYIDDWDTGIADGTYEKDPAAALEELQSQTTILRKAIDNAAL